MSIQVAQEPGDAPEFVQVVQRVANAIRRSSDVGFVRLIRLDNWFGPRWLRFSMNHRAHALPHRTEGLWAPESAVRIPPITPKRVVGEVLWRSPGQPGDEGGVACDPLHVAQTSDENLGRHVSRVAPDQALIWFSGASLANGRGAMMVYVPADRGFLTWYVELSADRDWDVVTPRGITKADFHRLLGERGGEDLPPAESAEEGRREWLVERVHRSCSTLTVVFASRSPSVAQLAALRRLVPELGELPPAMLRSRIDANGRCELGEFEGKDGRQVIERAAELGLVLERIDRSTVEYTIRDRVTGDEWYIANPARREHIAQQLLAAGASRIEVESD